MNVARVIAEYLAQAGVTHVFAYPGDPTIEFLESARRSGLGIVLGRREGTCAFMAEGLAQATGDLGVVVSTLGPGSTALVNGVAAAQWDRVPMLAFSGQIEASREEYFTHQVVDQKRLFGAVTKWAGRVDAGAVHPVMRKALRIATAHRPGAVHLSVGGDVFKALAPDGEVRVPPSRPEAVGCEVYRRDAGCSPLRALQRARRPVILAGSGAVWASAAPALARFAETVGAPVVTAPMAKGIISEVHPYFAGVIDMACGALIWDLLRGSDYIVAVGFDCVELIKPWTLTAPVLHIDSTPNTDQIYWSDVELIGHIPTILDWIKSEWRAEPRWDTSAVRRHITRVRAQYYSGRVDDALNPSDVIDEVRDATPAETVVSCDVGSHKLLVGQGWTATQARSVLMTNGLSSMGFGMPAAIAAKLALPSTPVAAFVGDGGFAMVSSELRLASALDANIAVVVFVDGSLNRIELKQAALGYPSTATLLESTDIVKLAESMECDGVRVSSRPELAKALENVTRLERPLVIEAIVDPSQYTAQF